MKEKPLAHSTLINNRLLESGNQEKSQYPLPHNKSSFKKLLMLLN